MKRHQIEDALRAMGIQPTGYNGKWVQARCPFTHKHGGGADKNPSFGVVEADPSVYYCFTCKSKGALKNLPQDMNMPLDKRAELMQELTLAEAAGLSVQPDSFEVFDEPVPTLSEEVYGDDLFLPVSEDPAAKAYCESRDLDTGMCDDFGIGAWPEDKRIMFPVRGFDDELYGWTGRAYDPESKPKVWNTPGLLKTSHLLGAHMCKRDRPMVVVEGLFLLGFMLSEYIDEDCDVDITATMGASMSVEQADMLVEIGQPVVMFFDNDKAGKTGVWGDDKTEGALHMLSRAGLPVKYVNYPKGVTDPDDLTADQIVSMIRNAQTFYRKRTRV